MKKVIYVGLGKLIISGISIILLRVYSDHLSLAEIGIITLLINFDSFFGLVYASPFGNYLSLSALSDVRDNVIHQRIASYTSTTFLSSILCLVIFLGYLLFFKIDLSFLFSFLFILYLFLNNSVPIVASVLAVINKTEVSMILQVVKSVSSLAAFILVFFVVDGVKGWVLGALTGALLPSIINFFYCRKIFPDQKASYFRLKGFINKEYIVKYVIPFALMQLALWFLFNSYRMYAGKLFDLEFLGQLGLAFIFASQFCSAFDSVLTQVYLADFYRLIDNSSNEVKLERFASFLRRVQPVYLLFLVLGFLPYVVGFRLLMGNEHSVDLTLLLAAWMFNFVRISFNFFGLITQVLRRPKMVTAYVIGGVVLSLLIFLPVYFSHTAITRDHFLLIVCLVPAIVIIFFIRSIGKLTKAASTFNNFLLTLIVYAGVCAFFVSTALLPGFLNSNPILLIILAGLSLSLIGIYILYLLKSLKRI